MDAIVDVAKNPDEVPRQQYNGRWRTAGVRDGIEIVVLIEQSGEINTGFPVSGRGVTRNPDRAADPANPTVADLVAGKISHFASSLLDRLGDRLPADDVQHYRSLHFAGEWEELADVLTAHLVKEHIAMSADEQDELRHLLNAFDIPVSGYTFINERDDMLVALVAG